MIVIYSKEIPMARWIFFPTLASVNEKCPLLEKIINTVDFKTTNFQRIQCINNFSASCYLNVDKCWSMSSVKEDDKVSVLMMPHITSVYRSIQRIVLNNFKIARRHDLESLWRWHICNIHCRWKRKSSFNHKYECIKNIDALGWLALFYWGQ